MEVELDFSKSLIFKEAFLAICYGQTDILQDLLPKLSNNLYISFFSDAGCRCRSKFEMIAYKLSISELNNLEEMADIIERGICDHVSTVDSGRELFSISLLHFACYFGQKEIAKLLIENGANVCFETTLSRYTPLQMTIRRNNAENIVVDIVSMLLDNGANASQRDAIDGQSILHNAVNTRYLSLVELLMKYNCDVNARDNDDRTALYLAVTMHRADIVTVLVNNKADVNKGPLNDPFLLRAAVRTSRVDIVTLLLTHNADVNCVGSEGHTPLLEALSCRGTKMMQELIKFGADMNHCNNGGYAAIHIAAAQDNEDKVDILLKNGCDYDSRTVSGRTPLSLACRGGHKSIALKLMNLSVNVNNTDKYLNTPLHHCSFRGCVETSKRLIELGADPKARNHTNLTPLWSAVYRLPRSFVRLLIELNVSLSVASCGMVDRMSGRHYDEPHTPLYVAFDFRKDPYMAAMLIIAGVNLSEEKWLRSTDLEVFNKSPGSAPHVDLLRSYTESPVSLKRLCRDEIRRRLSTRLTDALPLLYLPASITDYLLIKHDLDLCEAGTLDLLNYKFD